MKFGLKVSMLRSLHLKISNDSKTSINYTSIDIKELPKNVYFSLFKLCLINIYVTDILYVFSYRRIKYKYHFNRISINKKICF